MQDSYSLVLEILKQQDQLKMSIFQQEELASTLRHYSQNTVSFMEIDKLCQEIISVLNKTGKASALQDDSIKSLKKTGQLLWDILLPRTIKDKLKSSSILNLILSIDEELINIPWELLYDGNSFLCLKFNLGRLVRTKEQLTPPQYRSFTSIPKMLILANPTNDLKSAYLEGVFIRNQFDRKRREIIIDFKSTDIDTLYVKKNLYDYDIVHFAGHCEYEADRPQDSGWVLADGKFSASDILAMSATVTLPTLVFSNACYSAKVNTHLLDIDYQKKSYSLASAFLFSGVRHYIGSIRRIEDQVSLAFSKEFYSQLISGKSVGESLRLSRLKSVNEFGMQSFAWTSYLLYGDPNFVLFRKIIKKPRQGIKKYIASNKKLVLKSSLALAAVVMLIYLATWLPTLRPSTYFLFRDAKKIFLTGKNQEVIGLADRIISKDAYFLAAYPLLAQAYENEGDKENALKSYFDYALFSEKKQDKKNLACAYTKIGKFYQNQGDYPKAFDFFNKAINLSRAHNDKLNEAVALRRLAVWFIDKEDYAKALELLTQSSEINRERQYLYEHRYNLACDYFDIGLVFTNKDDLTTAKEFYNRSLKLFQGLKLKNELSDYYFNLGEICLFEKQYQKASDYYLQGLAIDREQNNKPNIISDMNMIGELYVEMDNLAEAEKFFHQAQELSKQIKAKPELATSYYNLAQIYKKRGRINQARDFLRQAQEIYVEIDFGEYESIKKELLSLDSPE
ncbi:MAG: hypothetical protein A3K83_03150 [Omnitrophica WOR_2 bacterium RBG_13_44_8b]|nr:MAG: hypothetical protein A3K83_03150 [Omnitrophica WOR_2 bacterium RBG_13_44_8b]